MMKYLLAAFFSFLSAFSLKAQYSIKGVVISNATKQPVEAATVQLQKDGNIIVTQATKGDGSYEFNGLKTKGTYEIIAAHVSLRQTVKKVIVSELISVADLNLEQSAYFLEPLEVRSIRASERAPFTKTNLSKDEIVKNNFGQDLPFLLNQTPSVVVNSDAGNGIGYTGIRIRGTDATRVNVTLNGIPYNDPESQGTFFVDLPDFASSVNSIQIQRGVGTSSNGAGAFGGTIALSTNEFNEKAYAEINNSYGSFNSWKNTVKVGSGLISDHFTVDARLSNISSDGYIDRAKTSLQSFYFSTAYVNKNSSLRFNVFSGKEKTYQAWNGVPENLLKTNRTFNSVGTEKPGEPYENETDNYVQDHYQLFFNHSFGNKLSFNTALFMINGKGYYEQYKAGAKFSSYRLANPVINGSAVTTTDLVRQLWLNNTYYGQILSLQYKADKNQLTLGGGWNKYDGKHYGELIWAAVGVPKNFKYYDVNADKRDLNVYGKWQHTLSNRIETFVDVQFRNVDYNINGFRNNPTVTVNRDFNFLNPKAGLSYNYKGLNIYASYALANKEPNRDDFEAGILNQPKAERLHDFELALEKRKTHFSYSATAYYMRYKNQLLLTGQINDVGAYTRVNVPDSYRAGIELQSTARLASFLNIAANLTLSENKINKSDEYLDDYDNGGQKLISHSNTNISFSPAIIGGFTLNVTPFKNAEISLLSKYVSRQYLDNTENKSRSLNPYFVEDLRLSYALKNKLFKECKLVALVGNVFNKMYEPNGYTFSYIYGGASTTENFYFPMAGTNLMVGLNIKL